MSLRESYVTWRTRSRGERLLIGETALAGMGCLTMTVGLDLLELHDTAPAEHYLAGGAVTAAIGGLSAWITYRRLRLHDNLDGDDPSKQSIPAPTNVIELPAHRTVVEDTSQAA